MAKEQVKFKNRSYDVIDQVWIKRKKYLLLKLLSGGARRRFLALDKMAGPRGALRIVQFMPNSRESLQRTEVLYRLSERNLELPQLIEFQRKKNEIVSVESWIEGRDLRWYIRKMRSSERQRLGTPECIRLFRQLAHAIHHLHRRCGVIHADIKPANIIVNNRTRRFSLIDFGSSWGMERTNERRQGDGKSQIYVAPEILLNQPGVDFRADYFSLASVCFETLTLQLPYDGLGSRAALPKFNSQQDSLFLPPSELSREKEALARSIWSAIDGLLESCLQLDRRQRPVNGIEWLKQWDSVSELLMAKPKRPFSSRLASRFMGWINSKG